MKKTMYVLVAFLSIVALSLPFSLDCKTRSYGVQNSTGHKITVELFERGGEAGTKCKGSGTSVNVPPHQTKTITVSCCVKPHIHLQYLKITKGKKSWKGPIKLNSNKKGNRCKGTVVITRKGNTHFANWK